ncbi:MAG: hypothetical protein ACT4O0_05600 [Pseudonocardia sp.]
MTVADLTDDAGSGRVMSVSRPGRLPLALGRCRRVVVVTVRLPDLLAAAAGMLQRFDAAGVPVDLLELAAIDAVAEGAALAAVGQLRLRHLTRHRLALPTPLGLERTGDVVAAASELIGFDPEPGVLCLVPGPGDGTRVEHRAVDAAAAVLGEAYRVRVMCFMTDLGAEASVGLEPSVVLELGGEEWRRKCDSLAAGASDRPTAVDRREYLAG